jgi:hypothetical protein
VGATGKRERESLKEGLLEIAAGKFLVTRPRTKCENNNMVAKGKKL